MDPLKRKIQQGLNKFQTAVANNVVNSVSNKPTLQAAQAGFKMVQPKLQQAYKTKFIETPVRNPMTMQKVKVSPQQIFKTAAPIYQSPLRAAAELKLSTSDPLNKTINQGLKTPIGQKISKVAFGDEPLKPYTQRYKEGYQIPVVNKTVKGKASIPLFAGGAALALSPMGGGRKTAGNQAVNIAKTSKTLDQFIKSVAKSSPEVKTFISNLIKDSRSPVNSIDDFFNLANNRPKIKDDLAAAAEFGRTLNSYKQEAKNVRAKKDIELEAAINKNLGDKLNLPNFKQIGRTLYREMTGPDSQRGSIRLDLGLTGGETEGAKAGRTAIQKNLSKEINNVLQGKEPQDVPFGSIQKAKAKQIADIISQSGRIIEKNDATIYASVIRKLVKSRIAEGLSPDTLADIAFSAVHGKSKVLPAKYPTTAKMVKQKANIGKLNEVIVGEHRGQISIKNIKPDNLRKTPLEGSGELPSSGLIDVAPQPAQISGAQKNISKNSISLDDSLFNNDIMPKSQYIYDKPPKARLSQQALSEGITAPRKGSDIAVGTQAGNKFRRQQELKAIEEFESKVLNNQGNQGRSFQEPLGQTQLTKPNPLDDLQYRANFDTQSKAPSTQKIQSQPRLQKDQEVSKLDQTNSLNDIINRSGLDVKKKIAIWDYVRTPDRVLEKIGLKPQMDKIRKGFDNYQKELPIEIDKITKWSERVSPDANQRIFKYLDGQPSQLDENELKVANEIKGYLSEWADRLKLPKEGRITNYITHIFDRDLVQKEFDPEFAALIRDKVAGSVYDPFVQERLGKLGYVEDTWRALDAYVKRATRKVNMDPALEEVKRAAEGLEQGQYNYVKDYIDKVNMRPTNWENVIDNSIKQVIGYRFGQRPFTVISRNARQMVYRATLGLNPGSALRNLSQGANTYAKLGEKYTVVGYSKMIQELAGGSDELVREGILKNDLIQDRTLSATRKTIQKIDKGLFFFFETAEKINRGAAYYGAKSKALSQGKTEAEAIEFAKKIVRDTQFTFGSIDTPRVLASDIGKTGLQFGSFTLKQGEFLGEMIKNKEFVGLARWAGASLLFTYTVGQAFGMKPEQLIPTLRIGVPPTLQLPWEAGKAIVGTPDEYGNERSFKERVEDVSKAGLLYVPASVQARKTVGGIIDSSRGYSESRSGKVRFPLNDDPITKIRAGVFGTNTLPEAQDYYNNKRSVLSENQTKLYKESADPKTYYNQVMDNRAKNKEEDKIKESVKSSGAQTSGDKIYYAEDGQTKTINLAPPTKGKGIDAFTNQNWQYAKAREVFSAPISQEQKNEAYKKLGVYGKDIEYDYKAHKTVDIKTQYLISKNLSHDELIKKLIDTRKRSISGYIYSTDGVINNLVDEGLITEAEGKALKKIDYDRKGKLKVSRGRGGGKISVPKIGKAKVGKVKSVKPKKFKLKKIAKAKKVKYLKVKKYKAYKKPKLA